MDKKMHLHIAILARLNNEGILKDLHFDRMPLARKAMICNKAMNLPEDQVENYYRNLAARSKKSAAC